MAGTRARVLALAFVVAFLATAGALGAFASEGGSAGTTCYHLTASVGTGSGQVQTSPSSNGGCADGSYAAGFGVTVIATASGGYIFTGWTGADDNNANPTTVTMTSDKTVTANFAANCYHLTTSAGSGGSVQASPPSTGGCPNGSYTPNYTVTVIATANSGYTFTGWTGADNNGTNPSTVTMSSDKSVSASFAQNCYHLTYSVGSGSGQVQASPTSNGGCPSGYYAPNFSVTLIATASGGSTFTGWTGTDNNSANPTTVTMTSDKTVTANFAGNCYHLTLGVGSGSGIVQHSPDNSGGCPTGQYASGFSVTIIATPNAGYTFVNWTGADDNNASSTTVTMTSDKTVLANFTGASTNTPTNTPTSQPTNTPTWTFTSTNTPTNTPQPTDQPTNTPTYTFTPTDTLTNTPTNTPLPPDVPTYTPTNTPTSTPTATPLPPGVPTPTPTSTLPPDAPTPTPTATNTPVPGGTTPPASEPDTATPTSRPANATPTEARANGDVDCNGRTNSIDAVYVLQFGAGMFFNLACRDNGDVSGDGFINSIDSALILQYTAGLVASLGH